MSAIDGGLAQDVTRALRRRWPGADVASTMAGRGRVSVTMPPTQARLLQLAGRGSSLEAGAAELTALLGRAVQVREVSYLAADKSHPQARYAVVIEVAS